MNDRSSKKETKKHISVHHRVLLALTLSLALGMQSLPAAAVSMPNAKEAQQSAEKNKSPVEAAATIVKLKNGSFRVCRGIPGKTSLDEMSEDKEALGYEMFYDGKSVLSASVMPVMESYELHGYYSISFPIPDTNKEAFITGLASDALESVQSQLLAYYSEGMDFSIEDLHIIDTEKTENEDADDLLCWAAATSNILHYSGWGAVGGFETEDDLFELFIHDNNESGIETAGITWFFDGLKYLSSNEKDENPNGAFIKDYTADGLYTQYDFHSGNPTKKISEVFEKLRSGYAVSLDIYSMFGNSGHAVTVWGYVVNNDFAADKKEHYDAVIISDSDSNELSDTDRRNSRNELDVKYMTPYNTKDEDPDNLFGMSSYDSWRMENYQGFVIMYMTTLEPFASAQPETDETATRNKRTTVDLCVSDCQIFNSDSAIELSDENGYQTLYPKKNSFAQGEKIYISPCVKNTGLVPFYGTMSYRVTVYNEDGSVAEKKKIEADLSYKSHEDLSYGTKVKGAEFKDLAQGRYKAVIELNCDRKLTEAYYINNSYECSFEVVSPEHGNSDAFVSFSIPNKDKDSIYKYADISYGSFDNIPHQSERLMISFYKNGAWEPWKEASPYEDAEKCLPEKAYLYYDGHMVNFGVLLINDAEHSESGEDEYTIIAAEPQKLIIPDLKIKKAGYTPSTFSDLERGISTLPDGKGFSFVIINDSDPEFNVVNGGYILEITTPLNDFINCTEVYFTMSRDEKEKRIFINSWDEDIELNGRCHVSLTLRTYVNGFYCTSIDLINLGTLEFAEIPSSVVTTGKDITDPNDGLTSLREAYEYCKQSGGRYDTITFAENMRNQSIVLNEPLTIDIPITIDGAYESMTEDGEPVLMGMSFWGFDDLGQNYTSGTLFDVTGNGELHLRGIFADYLQGESGVFVSNNGGKVFIDRCVIGNCRASEKGGGVYTDGGRVEIKNSYFFGTSGKSGAAIYMTGGADVDLLNTLMMFVDGEETIIENKDGSLDMVYCDMISCRTGFSNFYDGYCILSRGNTNAVACRITNDLTSEKMVSLLGNINVYASILENAEDSFYNSGDNLKAKELEVYTADKYGDFIDYRTVYSNDGGYSHMLTIIPEVKMQTRVNVVSVDGLLQYTADGENYVSTGIKSAFAPDEYNKDILGLSRVNYPGQGANRGEYAEMPPAPDNTEPDKPEPDKPEPDKPEPDKPEPDKPEPDKPEPDKPEPDKPKPDKPEPDKPEPDKPEPDKPEPDKPEPDKPKPDEISRPSSTPSPDPSAQDSPNTGDSDSIFLPIFLAATAALLTAFTYRRKHRADNSKHISK